MQYRPINRKIAPLDHPNSDAASAALQTELARLQRENRTLSIALKEMERIAERDMLTPLYNRRYFLSALHQRIAHVDRTHERVALIYVDVDELKTINDQFGHYAGDIALIEIASRLNGAMRKGDVLARIGGDEFGILLDKVSAMETKAMVRRLKGTVEDMPLDFDGTAVTLGASFGVTMIIPGKTAEELLGEADSSMYGNKRAA